MNKILQFSRRIPVLWRFRRFSNSKQTNFKPLTSLLYINTNMTKNGTSIDKVSKLLDVLDNHMKEKDCPHTPSELLKECES
jgi:hypothetical protein